MENQSTKSLSHAVFSIKPHIVFVTKYRRPVLSEPILDYLKTAFGEILSEWRCELVEFGGESNHRPLASVDPSSPGFLGADQQPEDGYSPKGS